MRSHVAHCWSSSQGWLHYCFCVQVAPAAVAAEQWGLCAAQEALRRYKDEVAADPDTESGFYYNTNAQNQTKQYVLVGLL